jgi:phosphatidylinositol-3-phosphatase
MMPLGNFSALASSGANLTNYWSVAHPSLPNYLALAGGSTFGVSSDIEPPKLVWSHTGSASTIYNLFQKKGLTWRDYEEDLPSKACSGTISSADNGLWASRHSPPLNFKTIAKASTCPSYVLSYSQFAATVSAGKLPKFSTVTPNICDDGHGGASACQSTATAAYDANNFLGSFLTTLESGSQWKTGKLVLAVTFDENEGMNGNNVGDANSTYGGNVPLILYSYNNAVTKQGNISDEKNAYSLVATIEAIFHLGNLGKYDKTDYFGNLQDAFSVTI